MASSDNSRAASIRALSGHVRGWWLAQNGNVRGGILALGAGVFLAAMVTLVKVLGTRLPVFEILLFRQVFMGLVAAPAVVRGFPGSLISKRPGLQLVRVSAASLAMVLGFSAVQHLQLSEITAISYSRALFITLLAIFVLGETVGLRRWSAVIVGFVGILVMVAPWQGQGFSGGVWSLIALISAFFVGVAVISVRVLSRVDAPVTILGYQVVFVGLLMLGPTIYTWVTPTATEWVLLVLLGTVSAIGQLGNIYAFKAGDAAVIATVDYVRLIYVSVLGYLVFAEIPTVATIAGASLVVAASMYTLWREKQVKA